MGCRVRHSCAQDAPKFKDFILPLLFYKRLSDAFDDRFAEQVATFGDAELAMRSPIRLVPVGMMRALHQPPHFETVAVATPDGELRPASHRLVRTTEP
jgi:type I restriction-modification system DNA methylase subunit